jgi:hypothetical protein
LNILFKVILDLDNDGETVDDLCSVAGKIELLKILLTLDVSGHEPQFRGQFGYFRGFCLVGGDLIDRTDFELDAESCLLGHHPHSLIKVSLDSCSVSLNYLLVDLLSSPFPFVYTVHVHPFVVLSLAEVCFECFDVVDVTVEGDEVGESPFLAALRERLQAGDHLDLHLVHPVWLGDVPRF